MHKQFSAVDIPYLGSSWPPTKVSAPFSPDGQERHRRRPAATLYLCDAQGAFNWNCDMCWIDSFVNWEKFS